MQIYSKILGQAAANEFIIQIWCSRQSNLWSMLMKTYILFYSILHYNVFSTLCGAICELLNSYSFLGVKQRHHYTINNVWKKVCRHMSSSIILNKLIISGRVQPWKLCWRDEPSCISKSLPIHFSLYNNFFVYKPILNSP